VNVGGVTVFNFKTETKDTLEFPDTSIF